MAQIPLHQHPAHIKNHCANHLILPSSASSERKKPPAETPGRLLLAPMRHTKKQLALARLETAIGFVDYISAATTANHAVVAVAALQGLQGVDDLHRTFPFVSVGRWPDLKARIYG
jgi:hypothetical protein